MPLVITKGYGAGGSAALLLVTAVTGGILEVRITFNAAPVLVGFATDPANWIITGPDTVTVSAVTTDGNDVVLTTTEQTTGATYTVTIPPSIANTDGVIYVGTNSFNFTGVGDPPFVAMAAGIDGFHVKVIFSEPVVESEALVPSNYVITGSGGLTVSDVEKETDLVYILTTSLQTVGASYTLTVSNIHDLYGNLI